MKRGKNFRNYLLVWNDFINCSLNSLIVAKNESMDSLSCILVSSSCRVNITTLASFLWAYNFFKTSQTLFEVAQDRICGTMWRLIDNAMRTWATSSPSHLSFEEVDCWMEPKALFASIVPKELEAGDSSDPMTMSHTYFATNTCLIMYAHIG